MCNVFSDMSESSLNEGRTEPTAQKALSENSQADWQRHRYNCVCEYVCVCCTGLVGEVVISLKQFQTYKNTSEWKRTLVLNILSHFLDHMLLYPSINSPYFLIYFQVSYRCQYTLPNAIQNAYSWEFNLCVHCFEVKLTCNEMLRSLDTICWVWTNA